jgi:hypothetical protein
VALPSVLPEGETSHPGTRRRRSRVPVEHQDIFLMVTRQWPQKARGERRHFWRNQLIYIEYLVVVWVDSNIDNKPLNIFINAMIYLRDTVIVTVILDA